MRKPSLHASISQRAAQKKQGDATIEFQCAFQVLTGSGTLWMLFLIDRNHDKSIPGNQLVSRIGNSCLLVQSFLYMRYAIPCWMSSRHRSSSSCDVPFYPLPPTFYNPWKPTSAPTGHQHVRIFVCCFDYVNVLGQYIPWLSEPNGQHVAAPTT